MGQTGSYMKKFWNGSGQTAGHHESSGDAQASQGRYAVTPFVFSRRGSMYFDEDGDLAHEFYEERVFNFQGKKISHMKRLRKNLRPQGEVDFPVPRLNYEFPVVICEAPRS